MVKPTTICALYSGELYLSDNVISKCAECGRAVQHRPHARKGPKLCMECACDLLPPDTKFRIPKRMKDEAAAYFRRKRS